jgi:DNA-binding beta-propeller fold protein YncE
MKQITLWIVLAGVATAADSGYHITKNIHLGGPGGWDYATMDSATRRLYVSHGMRVIVLDVDSGKVVGEITGLAGVHGIAIVPELNRGFITNGSDGTVAIVDLKTLQVLSRTKAGKDPDAVIYDPASRLVFACNNKSANVTAIDAKDGSVKGTIAVGGSPEFPAADGKGKVYLNLENTSETIEIDTAKLTVTRRYPLAPCEEPSGMAMDTAHRRLFIGCGNQKMAVVDSDSGKVLATLPIGKYVDANGFDPGTGLAFSSNGEGTLTVAKESSPGHFEVVENVPTSLGARTMAVDLKTHMVYLPSAKFGPMPAGTPEHPRPRPPVLPDSFEILVVAK